MLFTKHLCAASLQPISLKSLEGEISTEQQCLQLLRKQYSLSEIYRLTGKSRCYLRRLALLNDIPLELKPKKLTGECQKGSLGWPTPGCTERRYRSGAVLYWPVEQVISSQPGLVEYRKRCHWQSERRRCRLEHCQISKIASRSACRDCKAQCNAAFFWLYSTILSGRIPLTGADQTSWAISKFVDSVIQSH